MSRDKIPYLLAIIILLSSSVLLYQNNSTLSNLNDEKDQLTQDVSEQTQQVNEQTQKVQALTDQVLKMSETTEILNSSLIALLNDIEIENELERSTFAQVLSVERIIYAYMFEEKVNCTYSVNYSFPEPTETVFLVLDTDQITVLGHEKLSLEGTGVAAVKVEITLPEESGRWIIYPSVYWLSGDAPTYSATGWKKETSFDVFDVDPGHSEGSCAEESTKCHSG